MSSLPTTYLPLTTTFTGPAECSGTPWMYQNVPTTWWKQGGDNVPSCFPPAFPFSLSNIIYSPGICPAGWTSACDRAITTSGQMQTIVSCCPASFECASMSYDWENQFGCVSPYSIDTSVWGISPPALYLSSIYQLQVMIVEAETTTTSSLTTTTSIPTSDIAPLTSSAASSATSTAAPSSGEHLSKGAIAGISIGAVVGVASLGLLAYIVWTIRRKRRDEDGISPRMAQYPDYLQGPQLYEAPHYEPGELDGAARQPVQVHELKAS